jgi:hypothetical protein
LAPETIPQLNEIITALEMDEQVKVEGEYQCHIMLQVPILGFRAETPDWT